MIKLQRITNAETVLYKYMEQLMISSFPTEEYRTLEEQRYYTDTKVNFYNNIIFQDSTPVGFITYWDFGRFFYVEHFAIDPAQRNCGHGKNVLHHLCQLLKSPIILEVEKPVEEMAQRRINFYQRHGFSLWEKTYYQPPYKPGEHFLPMSLMAYGNLQCEKDFDNIKEHIYREVYNLK
ncbi:GNAT family N-acetyltransferase [Bacteroides helcogenes]|uniref:GCN5-related N-acetyltransferase n=1 Tax=Bacteroides helcogenes (strain ATCC 35417 / DSM 20613 / JCM 6297 / CCUG 15421 / P 36-108) TaxID=693979 RepID=E6ST20_BACT6|nr:GNAT family N-acetyltransferase [Bacteroides helcogenes]ADV45224.1 GCN5-related N-acetyltransferase [Bacteroides helcogenes P 36-108]MDY5238785.1 GNAT family N-acetyltransferase [Bacteroides helcogenes]